MIRYVGLLSAAFLWSGTAVAEITCDTPLYACLETASSSAGGIQIAPYCAFEAGTRTCQDDAPVDECTALRASLACTDTAPECVDYRNGACRQWRHTFTCLNENGDMAPASLLATEFGPTQEEIFGDCDALETDAACVLSQTDDIDGAGIRTINGKDFSRSWWSRARHYSCLATRASDTTCGPLESDPTCRLQEETCLTEEGGVCTSRSYHYVCGVNSGELETSCAPVNVCVGETCLGIEQETSDDFATSAAWLNVLAQMQEEYRAQAATDPNDVRFFQGVPMTCSTAPGRNCCAESGLFSSTCPESAALLIDKRAAGATHYLGVTCQEKVLGACVKKRYYFCTYNSKFGRVFIEEFKTQIAQGWGTPYVPDCGYVTIEDVGNVDIDAMDFSPVFGDIMGDVRLPVAEGIQSFYENRFPSADQDARDTFRELSQ